MSQIISTINKVQNLSSLEMICFLDPRHKKISPELKIKILEARYVNDLIADGLDVGVLQIDRWGKIKVSTQQNLSTIKGFVFESYFVRKMNDDNKLGKNAFNWSSNRQRSISDNIFKEYTAIGTGFLSTKTKYTYFYEPQGNIDIKFIRKNSSNIWESALRVDADIPVGIQIKAITANEKNEIIIPLLQGKYTHIITCLKHSNKAHSFDICMDIIKNMYLNKEINIEQRYFLERSIRCPNYLGFDQYEIDDYSEYIDRWYYDSGSSSEDIDSAINKEIIGYKYNQNGLLVPNFVRNGDTLIL